MKRSFAIGGLASYAIALAIVALACLAMLPFQGVLDSGHVALVLVLVVWASTAVGGIGPGLLSAVLAFSALLIVFVPPYYTLTVANAADWVTLAVFFVVAAIQGIQTGRMRNRERRAVSDAEALTTLAGQLVSESSAHAVGRIVAAEVARLTGASRIAVLAPDDAGALGVLATSAGDNVSADAGVERYSTWVMENGRAVGVPSNMLIEGGGEASVASIESVPHTAVVPGALRNDLFLPVSTNERTEAVLYIGPLPGRRTLRTHDLRVAVSLSRLLGAFLERHRLQSIARQAEALQEAERLKATLVSSVSHELKTPLAAMTATVTGLLATDMQPDASQLRRGLETVDDGLKRLTVSIDELLDISRLESDAWLARREPYEVAEIVGSLVGRIDEESRARISVEIPDGLPAIEVDFVQWSRALSNVLGNALAYSGPDGAVTIGASASGDTVLTWIEDTGPGIPAEERSRVFEKFYRGSASARIPSGTGLGLTIAQEIVRFNGGSIEVESAWPHGARVVISAPIAPPVTRLADTG